MTHICVGNLTITGSGNGLSPGRRQAITWTNAGILLIGPLGTNFSEILIGIQNAFESVVCEMASMLSRPQCVNCVLTVPGEHAHDVHSSSLKLPMRFHLQGLCGLMHCVDSLVLYLNSPARNDGTMLLWDADMDGVVSAGAWIRNHMTSKVWGGIHLSTLQLLDRK